MDGRRVVLQMKYARIIDGLAKKLDISIEKSMELFYASKTFEMIDNGIADLHCRSDIYLIDEIAMDIARCH